MSQGRRGTKVSAGTATSSHAHRFVTEYGSGRILPPVQIVSEISEGIIVSAMTVPVQRAATTARKSQDLKNTGRTVIVKEAASSVAPASDKSNFANVASDVPRDIRCDDVDAAGDRTNGAELQLSSQLIETSRKLEATLESEKVLKKQIATLECVVEDLRGEIKNKETSSADLRQVMEAATRLEAKYKELYEAECAAHGVTKDHVTTALAAVDKKERDIVSLRHQHTEAVESMRTQADKMLADLRDIKDREIALRDEKIKKMKSQMADAFAGNSWERQQQLDSLTKELGKAQDEIDTLRQKLRITIENPTIPQAGQVSAAMHCDNCQQLAARLEKKEKVIKDRERNLEEATALCSLLRKQLKDKDDQLKQWTSMQGRVLVFPK